MFIFSSSIVGIIGFFVCISRFFLCLQVQIKSLHRQSFVSSLKIFFTTLSSREWKLIINMLHQVSSKFIASFKDILRFSISLFVSILKLWKILAFVFGNFVISSIKSAKSFVFVNLNHDFLFSIIFFAIFLLAGSSQYSEKIFVSSISLYVLTIWDAGNQEFVSNLISSGQSYLKLNHLSASSTCKLEIHKS